MSFYIYSMPHNNCLSKKSHSYLRGIAAIKRVKINGCAALDGFPCPCYGATNRAQTDRPLAPLEIMGFPVTQ